MKICEMSNLLEMLLTTHILDHFPEHPSLSTTEFELRRAVRKPKQNSKQVMTTVFSCLHVPYETENANKKLTNWTMSFPRILNEWWIPNIIIFTCPLAVSRIIKYTATSNGNVISKGANRVTLPDDSWRGRPQLQRTPTGYHIALNSVTQKKC